MKFICKREEIRTAAPELYCIEKKSALTQAVIIEFMNLGFVTEEEKVTLRECIKAARAENEKNFMTPVRDKFIELFYEKQERESKPRAKKLFEDKF